MFLYKLKIIKKFHHFKNNRNIYSEGKTILKVILKADKLPQFPAKIKPLFAAHLLNFCNRGNIGLISLF